MSNIYMYIKYIYNVVLSFTKGVVFKSVINIQEPQYVQTHIHTQARLSMGVLLIFFLHFHINVLYDCQWNLSWSEP